MWGRRYFCGTVGEVKQRMIEEYRKAGKRRWERQFFDRGRMTTSVEL